MRLSEIAALVASLFAGLLAPAHGRPQRTSEGTAELGAFREAMRSREKILKSSQITFRELTFPDVELAPAKGVAGYAQFADGFEKWVRWEQVLEGPVDPKAPPPDEFWTGLSKDRPPRIDTADGSRSLSFSPDAKQARSWRGVLRVAVDSKIRIGALNCTMMFGERWLSDYCSRYKLSEFRVGPSGPEFTLVPETKVPNSDSVTIHTDAHYAPTRIVWSKGGSVAVEAIVLETVAFEGEQLPARGELHYHYTPASTNLVSFRYERLKPKALGSSLLHLPSEITSVGGTVSVIDELTRKPIPLGESTKATGQPQTGDPEKHEEIDSPLPIVLIVGLTGTALMCAVLLGIRTRWKAASA